MFTWICPRCGREIPPSYTDCPNCGKAEQASAAGTAAPASPAYAPPAAVPPPPAAPVASQPSFLDLVQEPASAPPEPVQSQPAAPVYQAPAPPAYQPPPPPVYQAPPPPQQDSAPRPPSAAAPASFLGLGQAAMPQQAAPVAPQANAPMPGVPARRGLPTWLLTVVFAALFVGLVGGVYWLVDGGSATNAKPAAVVAVPAAKPGAAPNPYQKYIEVSGVRFLEGDKNKKKPQVKFVVTNHSGADITGLGGSVTILGHGAKSEVQAAGSCEFSTSIGPWESKDLTVPLVTQLQMIELPDWQNVSTSVQITSPAQ
jgi:hypothetical protein